MNVIEFAYSRTLRTQSHRLRVIGYLGCKQGETRGASSGLTLTFGVRPDDQHEQAAALGVCAAEGARAQTRIQCRWLRCES